MISKFRLIWVLTGWLLAILLTGCYEHPEGCMDVRAGNYDVKADNACENCCKYPALNLTVSHSFEGNPVDTNTFLQLEEVPDVRIRSLSLYLSDFKLQDGKLHDEARIEELISVGTRTDSRITYSDLNCSVAKIKFGPVKTIQLGTFKNADRYKKLSFDFGLRNLVNHGVMDRISSGNGLYTETTDKMYINEESGYYFLKMQLQLEDLTYRTINLYGDELFGSIVLEHDFDFTARVARNIQMGIEYRIWFAGIDFSVDSDEVIGQKLSEQFGFSVNFF